MVEYILQLSDRMSTILLEIGWSNSVGQISQYRSHVCIESPLFGVSDSSTR